MTPLDKGFENDSSHTTSGEQGGALTNPPLQAKNGVGLDTHHNYHNRAVPERKEQTASHRELSHADESPGRVINSTSRRPQSGDRRISRDISGRNLYGEQGRL